MTRPKRNTGALPGTWLLSPCAAIAVIIAVPARANTDTVYDGRVIDEMRKLWSFQQSWAFNAQYKGKSFSDVGTLLGYGKSQYHLGWYVEVDTADVSKHESRNVYCVVSPSPAGNDFMKSMMARVKNFSKVTISGTMMNGTGWTIPFASMTIAM